MPKMIIIRGLPGSGKTTEANKIKKVNPSIEHYEADMFITVNGEYKFSPETIPYSHEWCKSMTAKALMDGKDAIVSNTFTQQWQIDPYIKMAKVFNADIELITCRGEYGSVHGVPEETMERMRAGWEEEVSVEV